MPLASTGHVWNRMRHRESTICTPRCTWRGSTRHIPKMVSWWLLAFLDLETWIFRMISFSFLIFPAKIYIYYHLYIFISYISRLTVGLVYFQFRPRTRLKIDSELRHWRHHTQDLQGTTTWQCNQYWDQIWQDGCLMADQPESESFHNFRRCLVPLNLSHVVPCCAPGDPGRWRPGAGMGSWWYLLISTLFRRNLIREQELCEILNMEMPELEDAWDTWPGCWCFWASRMYPRVAFPLCLWCWGRYEEGAQEKYAGCRDIVYWVNILVYISEHMQLAQAHPADAQYLDIPSEERLEDGTTCGYCQRGRGGQLWLPMDKVLQKLGPKMGGNPGPKLGGLWCASINAFSFHGTTSHISGTAKLSPCSGVFFTAFNDIFHSLIDYSVLTYTTRCA